METAISVAIRVGATLALFLVAAVVAHYLKQVIPEGKVKRLLYRKFYT